MDSDKPGTPLTPRGRFWFGSAFVLFGIFPLLATFDIGPLNSADINGPPWLGLAIGGVFVFAGLSVIVGPSHPILNNILAILVVAGLAAVGNWIAFGVGERVCGGTILFWVGEMRDLGCRIPFGIGALITNAIVLLMLIGTLQKIAGDSPTMARLHKWAENLLWLTLAPILLPMVVVLIAQSALQVLRTRLQTGEWPRNESFIARMKAKKARDKEG